MRIFLMYLVGIVLLLLSCMGPLDPSDPPPARSSNDTSGTTQVSQTGLIAHWTCNDSGSTLKDELGNCNGFISGALPDSGVDSVSCGGLRLNGESDIILINTSGKKAFNFGTGDFTVSLWVEPLSYKTITDSTRYDIISNGIAKERGFTISIFRNSFSAYVGQNKNTIEDSTFDASKKEWHHLVLLRHDSEVEFYVDTKKILSYENSNDITSPDSQIIIGDDASNRETNKYMGRIDDIKLYNTAWDLADIRNEYDVYR